MKSLLYFLAAISLIASSALAQDVGNDLVGLNLKPEQSKYINNRIGSAGTVAAAGSTQTDATALLPGYNVTLVTACDGTKGVKLFPIVKAKRGLQYTIINPDTTNACKVYSNAAAETISGQTGTTAITVAAKLFLECIAYDKTTKYWYCNKGVLPY